MDIGTATLLAREAGLSLERDEDGRLVLADGAMRIRGDFGRMAPRLKPHVLHREMLVKAAKIKGADGQPLAVDATAGLGEDSLLLAAAGFRVLLFERNPVISALLADAIAHAANDPALREFAERMQLAHADSVQALARLEERPDVVLLDPMFPAKHGDARAKKKLQIIQRLETPCEDEDALFDAALSAQPRKIVVKRPLKGPHLAGRTPSYSQTGKTIRYDVYLP